MNTEPKEAFGYLMLHMFKVSNLPIISQRPQRLDIGFSLFQHLPLAFPGAVNQHNSKEVLWTIE